MDDKHMGHEHKAPVLSLRTNYPTGGKGMKIARAAKQLAMLITVVALAVVTMACQGAVGPQGDQGPKGDKGDKGDTGNTGGQGPAGEAGDSPLAVYGEIKSILVNDQELPAGDTIVPWGLGGTVNAGESFFRGGYEPVKYALVAPVDNTLGADAEDAAASYAVVDANNIGTSVFKISISDGVISYEARDDEAAAAAAQYTHGTTFHVKATDDIKATETTPVIYVLRNRAPLAGGTAFTTDPIFIGTQDGFVFPADVDTDSEKEEYRDDPCNNIMHACVTVTGATEVANGHFKDEDPTDLTYMVHEDDPTLVSASIDGAKILLTGLKETGDVDESAVADRDPAEVKVSAVDRGGLRTSASNVRTLLVNVDPAPTTVGYLNDGEVLNLKTGATENSTTIDVSSYFDDTSRDGVSLEYTVTVDGKSDDSEKPDIVDFTIATNNITITAVNTGNAAVVVKATEMGTGNLGQYATQELRVRVN